MLARLTACRSLHALSLLGVVALSACSEPTTTPPDFGNRSGSRTSSGATKTTDTTTQTATGPSMVRFASWAPPLTTYSTSFTVVVGTATTFHVLFKDWPIEFLKVEIPANADFYDASGQTLRNGTMATVTVTIDPVYATVVFGPHGTQFKKVPANLYLNYYFLDLGGLAPSQLSIWYQPDSSTPWAKQATQLDVSYWWLVASLYHFSNYAIAY
jgi:hypothetical protein